MESSQAISDQEMSAQEEIAPVGTSAPESRGYKSPQADSPEQESGGTRRCFLGRSVRKLAYVSPVVLLLKPRPACASRIYS